jgi:type I restriction enzyme S subunit
MTTDLRPYPEYKDSGLPWLGKVPKHWDTRRAKYVLREQNQRCDDDAGTLLILLSDVVLLT